MSLAPPAFLPLAPSLALLPGQPGARRRGGPLLGLVGVLACWIAIRLSLGQSLLLVPAAVWSMGGELAATAWIPSAPPAAHRLAEFARPSRQGDGPLRQAGPARGGPLGEGALAPDGLGGGVGAGRLVGHALLLAAGFSSAPLASEPARPLDSVDIALSRPADHRITLTPYAAGEFAREDRADRWSVDGWLLLRGDTGAPSPAIQPSYGRSQAGAVLRYALAPGNTHRPQAYARVNSAVGGPREAELALGVSARPLPQVPLRLAAEARLANTEHATFARAAALAISEFPPVALPAGFAGEAYVQAGYVTGEMATGFVDGLARASRELARVRDFRLSAGAGAWGGAQRGAGRLDLGPSASLAFPLGAGFGQLAAEYRFRLAGAAAPASGPALSLSAGF